MTKAFHIYPDVFFFFFYAQNDVKFRYLCTVAATFFFVCRCNPPLVTTSTKIETKGTKIYQGAGKGMAMYLLYNRLLIKTSYI